MAELRRDMKNGNILETYKQLFMTEMTKLQIVWKIFYTNISKVLMADEQTD